jgi:formylglycine-generating enzyme required for sulfatase activity
MPRIFVSHSHVDDVFGLKLIGDLRAQFGEEAVWYDVSGGLHGGDEWFRKIVDEITARDTFIVILSPDALASKWVPREMAVAYWQQVNHGTKLLPLLYRACVPSTEWQILHMIDFTGYPATYEAKYGEVLAALGVASPPVVTPSPTQAAPPWPVVSATPDLPGVASRQLLPRRLTELGFAPRAVNGVDVVVPPLCVAPPGDFIMGSDVTHDKDAQANETPQYLTPIEHAYQIGIYPVTVAEYACAVRAKAVREPQENSSVDWEQKKGSVDWAAQLTRLDHPVVNVSWQDVMAYVRWLAQVTGQPWRLPTEAEWEKAARGMDGRIYPWGDTWGKNRANTSDGGPKATTPVGAYAEKGDASPYGVHDLAGNVWEWISSLYQSYPYKADDGRENLDATGYRVLRGGSWGDTPRLARVAFRSLGDDFGSLGSDRGFRLARVPAGSL